MDVNNPQTFSRDERLKHSDDFRRCIRRGGKAVGKYLVVYVLKNELGVRRLGAGSTKRLGNAVRRNYGKRLVREAFRLCKNDLPEDVDLVVLPKIPWREPTLEQAKADLIQAAKWAAEAMGSV
jgi:ribonuclease P protein component